MIKFLYIALLSGEDTFHGYTKTSDDMLKIFSQLAVDKIINVDYYNNPYNIINNDVQYDVCFINANPNLINNPKVLLQYANLKKRCKKIYLSIVWEAEPFPYLWNKLFESHIFDGYLCPSLFIRDLLKKSVNAPLFFYPHYINTSIYKQLDIEEKQKEEFFTIFTCGQLTERKSFEESIIAFCNSLGDKSDCRMIVKSNRLGVLEDDIDNTIKRLSKMNGISEGAIYSIKDETLPIKDMVDLYHNSSFFLLPSKGEGFGLNIYEALSCGLNCGYSNWSSFSQLSKNKTLSNYTYAVDGKIDVVKNMYQYGYDKKSKWFYPSIDNISSSLLSAYNNWEKDKINYYKEGSKNRKYIENNFSAEAIKKSIINILEGKEVFYG